MAFTVLYCQNDDEIISSQPFETKQDAINYVKELDQNNFVPDQKFYLSHDNKLSLITPDELGKPHKWFCEVCDSNIVCSDNPDSGNFYRVYGRKSDADDWHSIILAICNECDTKNALQVVDPQTITRT